jgi:hypothetical protein
LGVVLSVREGVPDTVTDSERETVMDTAVPDRYEPSASVEDLEVIVGAVVSSRIFLLNSREYCAPGVASVAVTSFPAKSRTVPPFISKALDDA